MTSENEVEAILRGTQLVDNSCNELVSRFGVGAEVSEKFPELSDIAAFVRAQFIFTQRGLLSPDAFRQCLGEVVLACFGLGRKSVVDNASNN